MSQHFHQKIARKNKEKRHSENDDEEEERNYSIKQIVVSRYEL